MAASIETLAQRSKLLRSVRDFFYNNNFIEVETPVKIPAPAPEEYIESVLAEKEFLRTSPELAMKVLLANGAERIFQMGSCFRANEFGSRHREEFTMLEYYAKDWNYLKLAEFTAKLFAYCANNLTTNGIVKYHDKVINFNNYEFITVDEAFIKYANVSAFNADKDDTFDEIMVTKVEPNLGQTGLTFLIDYPASRASLSRISSSNPKVAERWEIYAAGMELGNAFGELTCAAEQKDRFQAALKFRASMNMHPYPEPTEFYQALDKGLPESSGCAIGVDRFAMLLFGIYDIGDVRA